MIWKWLNGKKRHLAHVYWTIVIPSSVVIFPDGVPKYTNMVIAVLGIIFTSIGYGHAAIKKNNKKS